MAQASDDYISVIIPTYNSANYITEAIESVLQQTVPPQEVIVVDDGSTDDTESVVEKFNVKVRYVYQKKAGIASARNKGLDESKGELITFIDADDIWLKNKIELQLRLFQKKPDTEMVIGFLQRVCKSSDDDCMKIYGGDKAGIFVLQLGSTLIRREIFTKVGNFDTEMTMSEDLDWFLRAREIGINVEVHEDIVQFYRQHDRNTTKDKLANTHYMLKAIKKSLNRRKGLGITDLKIPSFQSDMDEILNFWRYNK